MKIQPYQDEDKDAIVRLWQACGLVVPANDPHKDIERKIACQADLLLVGKIDDRIVATVMVGYDGHRGWLNYVAVHPDCQKQGLGKRIMAEAERILRERGCAKINLQVRRNNSEVIDFYRRIGYEIDDVVGMGKRLVSDNV